MNYKYKHYINNINKNHDEIIQIKFVIDWVKNSVSATNWLRNRLVTLHWV